MKKKYFSEQIWNTPFGQVHNLFSSGWKKPTWGTKICLGLFGVLGLTSSVLSDFTPQSPAFPHGTGIVREEGGCSADTDNKCHNGLPFPSFNNFLDSGEGEGINDERRFVTARNLGPDGLRQSSYTDSTSVEIGDFVYVRAYIHNNGYLNDPSTTAHNVRLGLNGFTHVGNGNYFSPSGTSVTISQFISSSNAVSGFNSNGSPIFAPVTDDTVITSANGTPIRLLYRSQDSTSLQTTGPSYAVTPPSVNPSDFASGGTNIGDLEGCSANSFYTWAIFEVAQGIQSDYNLSLEKTVGTSVGDSTHKTITAQPGDELTYRLTYKNELSSSATPSGTKIYDDYDQTKLEITWLPDNPKVCTDDGDVITCDGYDLAPQNGQNEHIFYYTARIKDGVSGTIVNTAEVRPDNDEDTDHSDDVSSASVTLQGDYDLKIDKYVGVSTEDANLKKKTVASAIGESVTYRVDYENLSSSSATPQGVKIYDDYDQTKLKITWTSSFCADNGDRITCNGASLQPGEDSTFYYVAEILDGATSPINNSIEIVPDNDNDNGNNGAGPLNKTPYDHDINDSNDHSSASVTLQGDYDLKIDKYVGVSTEDANLKKKTVASAIGESVTYRVDYENLSSSSATPQGVKIYDDYDQTKLKITWTSSFCADNGDRITCNGASLQPGEDSTFYYVAEILDGATSPINNSIEIVPDNDNDNGNNGAGPLNKTPYDHDINDSNDHSSASVTLQGPTNGVCGDHNNDGVSDPSYTYNLSDTAYPVGFQFCMDGTAVPSSPPFPTAGNTVTWTCQGLNGGDDTQCSATKPTETPLDVMIQKSVQPTQAKAGDTVVYTLNYQNLTPNTTAQNVVIQDFLPSTQIDLDSIQFTPPAGVNCQTTQHPDPLVAVIQGRYAECIIGNLSYAFGMQTIRYTAQIKNTVNTGMNIDNIAKIITSSPETTESNNVDNARVVVIEDPKGYDLMINKKVDGVKNKEVQPGQTLTYTLEYQNLTDGVVAQNVLIYDAFDNINLDPSTLTFQSPLPTGMQCQLTSDDDPVLYILEGEHIRCSGGSLSKANGVQKITYTIKVRDIVNAGTTINNTATITANPDDDTNNSNDSSSSTVTVGEPPNSYDLMINKTVDGVKSKTVSVGSTITFTLSYKNLDSSSQTATGVVLRDDYDETKMQLITPLPTQCTDTAGVLTCTVGNLAVGQSGEIEFDARLLSSFTSGQTVNSATIQPNPDDDTNPANDSSNATITVSNPPINGQCGTAGSVGGKTYTSGTVAYPSGSTFCANGITPNPATPAFPAKGQTVSWTCSGSNGGASVSCKASRSSGGSNPDPDPETPVVPPSTGGGGSSGGGCGTYSVIDLNIAKYIQTGNGSFVSASSRDSAVQLPKNNATTVTYKVVISNSGDVAAYNVRVRDGFSSANGLKQSNLVTLNGATYKDGIFQVVQPIPANGSREFTYTATVHAGSGGVGNNTARIESMEQSYKCPKIKSERGVGRTAVAYVQAGAVGTAGYILDKKVDKQVVKAGDEVVYTLMIKNTGTLDMKNVILTDRFPSEYLEIEERLKPRLINNRTIEFKRKFLPVGDTFKTSFTMKVRDGVPKGTEIKNLLTGRSDNVSINDSAEAVVVVGESNIIPKCPVGYIWLADLGTCKRTSLTSAGISDFPLIPLGVMLMGIAFILRRNDIARMFQ